SSALNVRVRWPMSSATSSVCGPDGTSGSLKAPLLPTGDLMPEPLTETTAPSTPRPSLSSTRPATVNLVSTGFAGSVGRTGGGATPGSGPFLRTTVGTGAGAGAGGGTGELPPLPPSSGIVKLTFGIRWPAFRTVSLGGALTFCALASTT